MKNFFAILILSFLLLACGNRKESSSTLIDSQTEATYQQPDTIDMEDSNWVESPSITISSASSHSHESGGYDNMRGFDPASEDDMDDNGMSRYMENDDEEGWD